MSRIEKRSIPVPECGCWIWTGWTNGSGYGRLHVNGKPYYAHRLAYEERHGIKIGSLFVCHKCDTPSCVNPDHLFLGTLADNMKDMTAKGRHWSSKVSHCKKGHLFPPKVQGQRQRVCRICAKKANASYYLRKRNKTA